MLMFYPIYQPANTPLTAGVYGNNGTRKALLPRQQCRLAVVVVRRLSVQRRRVRRSIVEADDAEVVGGAARRRRPVVRVLAGGDAVGERNPLPDGAVLDDVVVGWPIGRRHRPRDVKAVAERSNCHVERRRRPIEVRHSVYIIIIIIKMSRDYNIILCVT